MEDQILISKFNKTYRLIYVVGLCLFIGLAIGCFSNYESEDAKTTRYLAGTLFFLVFPFFIILEMYYSPRIVIRSGKVEFVRFFNIKTELVELSSIQSWVSRNKKSKYGDYQILYLVLNNSEIVKLKSYHYSDFYSLELSLTDGKPINQELDKRLELKENRRYSFMFFLIGFIPFLIAATKCDFRELTNEDISSIRGRLSQPLKIESERYSSALIIRLKEFPEFAFRVGGLSLDVTSYDDLMKDFQVGQSFEFAIEKEVYDKKISEKTEVTFWDLIFHYDSIQVVEIIDNDLVYLSLEVYNEVKIKNSKLILLVCGVLGLLFIACGIVMYKKRFAISVGSKSDVA